MHISTAAGCPLPRIGLEGHQAASVSHDIVIGVERRKELIRAGKILQPLPVLSERAEPGIEARPLYPVSPDAVARCHEHVAPCPSVIDDIASLV